MSDIYARSAFDKSAETRGNSISFDGNAHSARSILESARYQELDRKQSFYDCTQHDLKQYDFDGRIITGAGAFAQTQPLLSGAVAPFYVPLKQRRPSSPYRLARSIVHAFTDMLFGQSRFPTVSVSGDDNSSDFVRAVVVETNLAAKMLHARNIGGSMGSVGLSWCFVDGAPKVEVHNPKQLWVHTWRDREQLIPSHVTEVQLYEKDEFDPVRRTYGRTWYWSRRDWTEQGDFVFYDVPFEAKGEPIWAVDPEQSVVHNEGTCHFVWIQNSADAEVDGQPDYHGQYEMFDSIDLLFSVIVRGTTLNLDPTLVLRMDPELVARQGVRKGSDNALTVGETGGAEYLEMNGAGIAAGLNVLREKRRYVLEATQCVIPEPTEIAAQGTSSVALKMIYAPMLARCDQFRDMYGAGIVRLLKALLTAAQRYCTTLTKYSVDENGVEQIELPRFKLTPKEVPVPVLDALGEPTGEVEVTYLAQHPGSGSHITLAWGPYFPPTESDKQAAAQTMQSANGGKPLLSQQTSSEVFAAMIGRDATQEWNRMQTEAAQAKAAQTNLFADAGDHIGGRVDDEDDLPPAALPSKE